MKGYHIPKKIKGEDVLGHTSTEHGKTSIEAGVLPTKTCAQNPDAEENETTVALTAATSSTSNFGVTSIQKEILAELDTYAEDGDEPFYTDFKRANRKPLCRVIKQKSQDSSPATDKARRSAVKKNQIIQQNEKAHSHPNSRIKRCKDPDVPKEKVEKAFEYCDKNKDGKLDIYEFKEMMKSPKTSPKKTK